jgi:hypothetical protein
MLESRTSGSARAARSNPRPYRDHGVRPISNSVSPASAIHPLMRSAQALLPPAVREIVDVF